MFDTINIYTCDNSKLDLIISKLKTMGENVNQVLADLQAANAKIDKVSADVDYLTSQIGGVEGETPTPEEWAAIKSASAELNTKLQAVDDKTPDQPTTEPPTE